MNGSILSHVPIEHQVAAVSELAGSTGWRLAFLSTERSVSGVEDDHRHRAK
jgi:hypothetical protein